LYNTADQAIVKHRLVEQFANSGVDATFIVPEAPWEGGQSPQFPDLNELLQTVSQHTKLGSGPLVIIGHSAAHVTIRKWLTSIQPIQHIVLLDALYAGQADFKRWVQGSATRRLTVLGQATDSASRALVTSLGGRYLPAFTAPFPKERVIGAKSQWGHHAIVEDGFVIPAILRHTDLLLVNRQRWVPWAASALVAGALGFGGWYYASH
jgi:hypothetical protein